MSINVKYDSLINSNSTNDFSEIDETKSSFRNKLKSFKESKLGKFIIAALVFGLMTFAVYSFALPFLPKIQWILTSEQKYEIPYSVNTDVLNLLNDKVVLPTETSTEKVIPKENRVVLPTIKADMAIIEAPTEDGLTYGAWRLPSGGTPGNNNFVLTCHRLGFGFLPDEIMKSSSCYNLDKLSIGDPIIVYWEGKEYDYTITAEERVTPDQTRIQDQTADHKLTIYTCDPIGVNTHRLVKYARLMPTNTTSSSTASTVSE